MHGGIDPATKGKTGIDALSLTDGKVFRIGSAGFGPHAVTIQSPLGTYFTYGNLASSYVTVGSQVVADTPIGEIGNLGDSTGIQVHIQASLVAPFPPSNKILGIKFP